MKKNQNGERTVEEQIQAAGEPGKEIGQQKAADAGTKSDEETAGQQGTEKQEKKREHTRGQDEKSGRKKLPVPAKIAMGVLAAVLVLGVGSYVLFDYFYHQMNIQKAEDEMPAAQEYFDTDENTGNLEELDPNSIQLDSAAAVETDKEVVNILLCGEEAIGGGRGRTDSIMIATINSVDQELKLTSIMRDSYVQIPGYTDNKINAAYHNGGMASLIKTVKTNFGIEVDGYVLVNFDSFEDIVDAVGGIDITLDEKEVRYLNSTNYISDPSNHTLSVGKNHMNGNQALGFARVRYVMRDGEYGDFARTLRHRTVMQALFQRVQDKSTLELIAMIPKILPMLTTDIKKNDLVKYITMGVKVREQNSNIATLNVPVEGAYKITRARGMSIILPEPLSKSVDQMQEFIYGSALTSKGKPKKDGAKITIGQ